MLKFLPMYLPIGLVGWWGFSGNANDARGNVNNFTEIGATLIINRNGTPNAAY